METRPDSNSNILDHGHENNVSVTANPIPPVSVSAKLPSAVSPDQSTTEAAASSSSSHAPSPRTRRPRPCRYFRTKNGCRLGDRCPFLHDANLVAEKGGQDSALVTPASTEGRRYMAARVDQSRVVQKPVSSAQELNPREFQIGQLRRRFSPQESKHASGSSLVLRIIPSDPDFPFEIDALECVLEVPLDYPRTGIKPWLKVTNKDIPRGYQINIENGFRELVERTPQATLLQLMNALDKSLERYLSEEKKATIKIVSNVKTSATSGSAGQVRREIPGSTTPRGGFDVGQRLAAKARRDRETSQLEARLGRLPLFSKSADGVTYVIPLEPRKPDELPVPLQGIRSAKLIVPEIYNLEPCRLELQGVSRDAAARTEKAFEQRAREYSEMTLMAHVNYLAQNLHVLATAEDSDDERYQLPDITSLEVEDQNENHNENALQDSEDKQDAADDRSHIKVIPRPPEWNDGGEDNSEEEDLSTSPSELESEDEEQPVAAHAPAIPSVERGTSLSFPSIELHGIELLELVSLSIVVRCERCKQIKEINNLKNNATTPPAGLRSESCGKCAQAFSIGYRREFIHTNSMRAGLIDLVGCQVIDMLPSRFIPTCANCSTAYPSPGVVSVRGESSIAFCRDCHSRMQFKLPEVKFLIIGPAGVKGKITLLIHQSEPARSALKPRAKKPKENLGITAGQELPRHGACAHYRNSKRWFRFSCCSRVFPCDKCHDEASDHPNEHANRMICGFCSREQNYRPEDCAICHAVLIRKRGSGFWEGGKGTRDKTKMSRKDPRKYKRRAG